MMRTPSFAELLGTPDGMPNAPHAAARPSHGDIAGIVRVLEQGKTTEFQAVQTQAEYGGSYTVSLGIRPKPTPAQALVVGPVDAPIECWLTFGLGGASERRIPIDWLNGTLLQVPTGGFKIEANYPAIAGAKPYDFELSSIIMPSTRPPSAGQVPMARRTLRIPSIASLAQSARVRIPPRGHTSMLLLPDALYYGNIQINWDTNDAALIAGNVLTRTRPAGSDEQVIPNGAQSFTLSNLGGSPMAPFLVFGLAL